MINNDRHTYVITVAIINCHYVKDWYKFLSNKYNAYKIDIPP